MMFLATLGFSRKLLADYIVSQCVKKGCGPLLIFLCIVKFWTCLMGSYQCYK